MIDLYSTAWRSLKAGGLMILVLSVLLEALPLFFANANGATGGTVVAYAIYAYSIHRYLLLAEPISTLRAQKTAVPHRMGSFILISGGFILFVLGASFILALNITSGTGDPRFLATFLVLAIIVNLVILSLFGTILPAAAIGDAIGPGLTWARIRATGWKVFGGLLVGPGLVGACGIALTVGLEQALDARGVTSGAVAFLLGVVARAVGLVNTTFAVVVICHAYRSVVPATRDQTFS
jgi:hypothetical protein